MRQTQVCLEFSLNKFYFLLNKFHLVTSNAHKFVCWELSLNKFDQSIDRPRLSGSNTWWEEFEFIHKLFTFPGKPAELIGRQMLYFDQIATSCTYKYSNYIVIYQNTF